MSAKSKYVCAFESKCRFADRIKDLFVVCMFTDEALGNRKSTAQCQQIVSKSPFEIGLRAANAFTEIKPLRETGEEKNMRQTRLKALQCKQIRGKIKQKKNTQ